jgi:hypothetical protein
MGTRSRIGVMHGDTVKSVYCHWDGYLEHNGAILQEHYDSAKANNLVALGDLSSLRKDIGEKHAFSKFDLASQIEQRLYEEATQDMCTFYGRDRGETGTEWKVAHTFAEFLEQVENCGGEYYYIMKDGVWYAGALYNVDGLIKNGLVQLDEALATVKMAEEN